MPDGSRSRWWVVGAMSAASIVLTIDLFGVNVALPTIARDLDLSTTELQWVPSIYFLALAAPLVAAGRIGDVFGRRKMLVAGAGAVVAGSVLAAVAGDGTTLLVARAVTGVGAAFVTALSLTIVSEAFGPERRGLAIGLWSGIGAIGAAAGPLVGGVVTQAFGWRWLFALNVPIALAAIVVTTVVVRESRDPTAHGIDVAGLTLVTAGFALLSFGLLEAPQSGWGDPQVVLALVGSAVALVAFVYVERRVEEPLVDMSWIGRPPALGTGLVALAGNAAFATVMLYLTLYFQDLQGDGPITTGLAFLAFTIPLGVGSPVAGTLTNRIPPRTSMALGTVLLIAGGGVFLLLSEDAPVWLAYAGLALSGAGQAVVFNVTNLTAVASVPTERQGMAAGVISGVRQAGSLVGLAAAGAAFAAIGGATGTTDAGVDAAEFVDAFRGAIVVTVGLCVLGLLATAWVGTARVSAPASAAR